LPTRRTFNTEPPSFWRRSLAGAVIGSAGLAAVDIRGFTSIVQALVFSPIAALVIGFLLMWVLRLLFASASPHKSNRVFRSLQIVSAAFQSFTHGTNDAQKTMGVITFALIAGNYQTTMHIPLWVKFLCATAMGLGTASGGWRIIKTVGSKIIKLEPINGFASDLTSATVILTATLLQQPVSSTHVIASAVMGTGAAKRFHQVNWGVAGRIVVAWFITIPICGVLSGVLVHGLLWMN